MRQNSKVAAMFKVLNNFLIFFLVVAFLVTCCTLLFSSILRYTLDVEFTEENISQAAKLTFLNVLLLSLLLTIFDYFRRKVSLERPCKSIVEAAKRIAAGDYDVRIPSISTWGTDDSFNEIIECFNSMAEELGSVETLRTDFVSSVSHEIKTPISVIKNYGSLLSKNQIDNETRLEYSKCIVAACDRLSDMVTNILKLSRLDNQQVCAKKIRYNLSEQLVASLLQYEEVFDRKGIDLDIDMDEGVYIDGDEELLLLVWNNLFSNAFKFTDEGGKVSLKLIDESDKITVKISDTGPGMTREVGSRIFDKFYQGDTSHSTEGNGLGLALVKKVIDIIGAQISIESRVGEGTAFTVTLMKE